MRKFWIAALLLLLSACASASQIMQGYVGHDVRDVMLDYGPPANAFDMADGRRAFQWVINSSYTTPTYATSNSYGYQSWVTTNTTIHGGQTITSRCIYTLFARWNETASGWTVVGYKKPKWSCE